jgi:hypothetical protein
MNLEHVSSFVERTPSHLRVALWGKSVVEYWLQYFSHRRFPKNQEFYVVYTSMDHSIPFQPDSALYYWLVNLDFIPTSVRLQGVTSREFFDEIRHAYVDIAREGCAAFRETPTIMPYLSHNSGHALHAAHALLKPINCSPSLHTAVPFYAYNLGANYFPEKERELRECVGKVVSTVLKTKLHAMIDIAFGIFLARKMIADRLKLNFNDLESFFIGAQQRKDGIPYEHVYGMYHEITELQKTYQGNMSRIPKIMERYFQELGLPRVNRQRSNCLFDLEQKVLVYPSELRVRNGLL